GHGKNPTRARGPGSGGFGRATVPGRRGFHRSVAAAGGRPAAGRLAATALVVAAGPLALGPAARAAVLPAPGVAAVVGRGRARLTLDLLAHHLADLDLHLARGADADLLGAGVRHALLDHLGAGHGLALRHAPGPGARDGHLLGHALVAADRLLARPALVAADLLGTRDHLADLLAHRHRAADGLTHLVGVADFLVPVRRAVARVALGVQPVHQARPPVHALGGVHLVGDGLGPHLGDLDRLPHLLVGGDGLPHRDLLVHRDHLLHRHPLGDALLDHHRLADLVVHRDLLGDGLRHALPPVGGVVDRLPRRLVDRDGLLDPRRDPLPDLDLLGRRRRCAGGRCAGGRGAGGGSRAAGGLRGGTRERTRRRAAVATLAAEDAGERVPAGDADDAETHGGQQTRLDPSNAHGDPRCSEQAPRPPP